MAGSCVRIKHIDNRYNFTSEHIKDDFIKILFVRTENIHSDLFTKNVNVDTYKRHLLKFSGKRNDCIDVIRRVLEYDPICSISRGQSQFMVIIYFRLFLELDLLCQAGM
jgi:hypothetical protein